MAVRDEEQRPNTGTQLGQAVPWTHTLSHMPAIVVVSGLALYGYLSLCYERFYRNLGIDPNDVGLSYIGILTRSSGFVVTIICITAVAYVFFDVWRRQGPFPVWRRIPLPIRYVVLLLVYFLPPYLFVMPWGQAESAAVDVVAGKAVGPVRTPPYVLFPLTWHATILAIHADPATLEPTGKPGDSPAAERLRGRRLLYLGQSGGTVVMYDAAVQRAVYAPAGSIFLHIANCQVRPPPDPACN